LSDDILLSSNTIFLDVPGEDYSEVFSVVSEELLYKGFVEGDFLTALIEREKKYPTGLQCEDHVIAIPHADPVHIKRPFIAVVRTIGPISFMEMTNSGVNLKTRMIFILGLKRDGEQVKVLRAIMENFAMKSTLVNALLIAKSTKECLDILKPLEIGKEF